MHFISHCCTHVISLCNISGYFTFQFISSGVGKKKSSNIQYSCASLIFELLKKQDAGWREASPLNVSNAAKIHQGGAVTSLPCCVQGANVEFGLVWNLRAEGRTCVCSAL